MHCGMSFVIFYLGPGRPGQDTKVSISAIRVSAESLSLSLSLPFKLEAGAFNKPIENLNAH